MGRTDLPVAGSLDNEQEDGISKYTQKKDKEDVRPPSPPQRWDKNNTLNVKL